MALFQCGYHIPDVFISTHHLYSEFGNSFDSAFSSDIGSTAREGSELALAQHLPATTVIIADSPGASHEHGLLDLLCSVLRYKYT